MTLCVHDERDITGLSGYLCPTQMEASPVSGACEWHKDLHCGKEHKHLANNSQNNYFWNSIIIMNFSAYTAYSWLNSGQDPHSISSFSGK